MIRKSVLWSMFLMFFMQHASSQQSQNKTVLLFNLKETIPFRDLSQAKIAVVTPNKVKYADFVSMMDRYAEITVFDSRNYADDTKFFNTIVLVGGNEELGTDLLLEAQQAAANGKKIVLCTFIDKDNHLQLQQTRFAGHFTELVSPQIDRVGQENLAMSLFGGMAISQGLDKNKTKATRIQYANTRYTQAQIAGLTQKIDAIAREAIAEKAAPGMVVMAIKDGQLLFEKAYGYHTYENKQKNRLDDIFDLASVSKIAGTTPVVMHLQETGKIVLEKAIGEYLWDAKQTDKANITVRSVLLHEAGFTPYIPFYRYLKPGDLSRVPLETHQVKVADSAYLVNNYYKNVMWPDMLKSASKPVGNYVYSDISMYVMKEIAEQVTSTPMDQFVSDFLYKPIGMKTAGYNPRNRFAKTRIVPTEQDTSFRKVLLEGYVHDQGAAMAGGIAGHAGLFGSAYDMAIYGQLLLNKGTYGGIQYFLPATVDLFTSRQSASSRRGLGFDRYDPNSTAGYPSKLANSTVYGHTGYTGTCVWIDPQNQLIYIFLSNRVHPQVSTKLLNLNVRSRMQDAIYETIIGKK